MFLLRGLTSKAPAPTIVISACDSASEPPNGDKSSQCSPTSPQMSRDNSFLSAFSDASTESHAASAAEDEFVMSAEAESVSPVKTQNILSELEHLQAQPLEAAVDGKDVEEDDEDDEDDEDEEEKVSETEQDEEEEEEDEEEDEDEEDEVEVVPAEGSKVDSEEENDNKAEETAQEEEEDVEDAQESEEEESLDVESEEEEEGEEGEEEEEAKDNNSGNNGDESEGEQDSQSEDDTKTVRMDRLQLDVEKPTDEEESDNTESDDEEDDEIESSEDDKESVSTDSSEQEASALSPVPIIKIDLTDKTVQAEHKSVAEIAITPADMGALQDELGHLDLEMQQMKLEYGTQFTRAKQEIEANMHARLQELVQTFTLEKQQMQERYAALSEQHTLEIQQLKSIISTHDVAMSQSCDKLQDLENEKDTLANLVSSLQKERDSTQQDLLALEAKHTTLLVSVGTFESEISSYKTKCQELEKAVNEAQEQHHALASVASNHDEFKSKHDEIKSELEGQIEQLKNELKSTTEELDEISTKSKESEKALQDSLETCATQTSKCTELEAKLQDMKQTETRHMSDLESLQSKLDSSMTENSALKASLDKSVQEVEIATRTIVYWRLYVKQIHAACHAHTSRIKAWTETKESLLEKVLDRVAQVKEHMDGRAEQIATTTGELEKVYERETSLFLEQKETKESLGKRELELELQVAANAAAVAEASQLRESQEQLCQEIQSLKGDLARLRSTQLAGVSAKGIVSEEASSTSSSLSRKSSSTSSFFSVSNVGELWSQLQQIRQQLTERDGPSLKLLEDIFEQKNIIKVEKDIQVTPLRPEAMDVGLQTEPMRPTISSEPASSSMTTQIQDSTTQSSFSVQVTIPPPKGLQRHQSVQVMPNPLTLKSPTTSPTKDVIRSEFEHVAKLIGIKDALDAPGRVASHITKMTEYTKQLEQFIGEVLVVGKKMESKKKALQSKLQQIITP